MSVRAVTVPVLLIAFGACCAVAAAQDPSGGEVGYTAPRTPWGDPDLEGIWPGVSMVGVPLQRPERTEAPRRPADEGPVLEPGDGGEPQRRVSLIVDPPDGRLPPLTDAAQRRAEQLERDRRSRGPADSYTDRSLVERCITRGIAGTILPTADNNGSEIVQSPGSVAIRNEMLHETRVIPLDGRPHVNAKIRMWMGDSRGRWEGDTLVVETTNLTSRTAIGVDDGRTRHSEEIRVTERLTRVRDDALLYEMTIDDPQTWTRPWTMRAALARDDDYRFFEHACHENNYAMYNILSDARAEERRERERRPDRGEENRLQETR